MAENVSIISIPSSDDDILVSALEEEEVLGDKPSTPKKFTSTPQKITEGESTKTVSPKKILELSPLKVLDLSWASQADKSIDWDQTIVISSELETQMEISSPESQRNEMVRRLNYTQAVRAGLHLTMTQLATELLQIENDICRMKKELDQMLGNSQESV